ncbi:MAG: asparaginase [Rhodospirillaceae bacterium]|nr:asparaginase [Rhodospirillaceae bacterium]
MSENANPVLVEVTRGGAVESRHRGAACVFDSTGAQVLAWGDVAAPVFPRSTIKLLQAVPFLETGAADICQASFNELALACASHGGERAHVAVARAWMERLGLEEGHLACGAHRPYEQDAADALIRAGEAPSTLHNNCSGKHLAMLATALANDEPLDSYHEPEHPVQRRVRDVLSDLAGEDLAQAPVGIDGCSVPTWGITLSGLARAMARVADPRGLKVARQSAIRRLRNAVARNPFMVAGTGRFCTALIGRKSTELYVKTGAEGMFVAALYELGVGVAIKIDDGAKRAAEVALAAILRYLEVLDDADWDALADFAAPRVLNRMGRDVGEIRTIAGWPHGRPSAAPEEGA